MYFHCLVFAKICIYFLISVCFFRRGGGGRRTMRPLPGGHPSPKHISDRVPQRAWEWEEVKKRKQLIVYPFSRSSHTRTHNIHRSPNFLWNTSAAQHFLSVSSTVSARVVVYTITWSFSDSWRRLKICIHTYILYLMSRLVEAAMEDLIWNFISSSYNVVIKIELHRYPRTLLSLKTRQGSYENNNID